MSKFRLLVVDDSAVFRRLVSEELSRDPDLEVVGTAANGRIALAKLTQLNPDLVILDLAMPEMDGLEALKELRKTHPRLPVIIFSSLTELGAEATLDALSLGATDYFTKPSDVGGLDASLRVIREQLVPEIKALCAPLGRKTTPAAASPVRPADDKSPARRGTVRVLAVGSSTGGPNALAEVFMRLPADIPVPILIVQHMPPVFTRSLAERLTAQTSIRFQEATSGCLLNPGEAWIAPGDHHMTVVRDGAQYRLLLNQDPPENSCRPAVDVLFRSVAHCFGADSLAVILTGMGRDGFRGCEAIREVGGQVLVQDEATSVVWGMPGYVVQAGLADCVVPLPMIAAEILERVRVREPKRSV